MKFYPEGINSKNETANLIDLIAAMEEDATIKLSVEFMDAGTPPKDILDACRVAMGIIGKWAWCVHIGPARSALFRTQPRMFHANRYEPARAGFKSKTTPFKYEDGVVS